ncbi:type I restriction-modification system subunit M [Rossellomorea arthrocnemi]|uniref:type I restriction-modification system subunit M n=1 Tax=Rossellomorea arthrocnemi TaxID=2769542 RepID=UPI00191914F8|nr:type I restriction-modification system subunit M [Rossellomorea arthrocnemi]
MTTSERQRQQQAELHKKLWAMANDLRGQMDASEFKDYILGLIFYRYLSEKVEARANALLKEDNISFAEAWKNEEYREDLAEYLIDELGYVVEPQFLFSQFLKEIEKGANGIFDVEMLQNGVKAIESSTLGSRSQEDFQNLFDDMDLTSSRLGRTVKDRTSLISKVIVNIAEIPFLQDDVEIDILGDAYEYMISQFAANAGKKAGEFYTPQQVSRILAKIVTADKTEIRDVYDGACGSGSLLLRVGREAKVHKYYGQEKVSTTYNLARMNMLLHDVPYQRFDIQNADTLEEPQHLEQRFEAIVVNPPYSAKWSADDRFKEDERFSAYAKLAPKSKADFAFIQHFIHQLDDNGTMAVVLPHGVLFRGAAEATIRRYLIEEKNYLDAVIGLPANIFYGTSIPTCILVFKKCRNHNENVLFIDASNEFEKGKNQNHLSDQQIEKIITTFLKREVKDKYSYAASLDEIRKNEFNLNIPRYVDTFEEEVLIDLSAITNRLKEIDEEIKEIDLELDKYFKDLEV